MNQISIYPYGEYLIDGKVGSINVEKVDKLLTDYFVQRTVALNSARVGIVEALRFFDLSRQDNILIPDFLSQCVLDVLNIVSFPVKKVDEKTKAVLVLHQWGYPQRMDEVMREAEKRNLIIIEDCAHTFDSKYKGQKVGTFGHVAVYSFSKMLPTYMGGCLVSKNNNLINKIITKRLEDNNLLHKVFKIVCFWLVRRAWKSDSSHDHALVEVCYSQYHRMFSLGKSLLNHISSSVLDLSVILKIRKENYAYLIKNINSSYIVPDHDSDIDVNPLCFPIFPPLDRFSEMAVVLRRKGFLVEELHFDVNRNVFNSDYRKCLVLPCHQYLKQNQLEELVSCVNSF